MHPGVRYSPAVPGTQNSNGRRPVFAEEKKKGRRRYFHLVRGGRQQESRRAGTSSRRRMRAYACTERTARKNRTAFLPLHIGGTAAAAAVPRRVLDSAFCRDFAGCTGGFLRPIFRVPRSSRSCLTGINARWLNSERALPAMTPDYLATFQLAPRSLSWREKPQKTATHDL